MRIERLKNVGEQLRILISQAQEVMQYGQQLYIASPRAVLNVYSGAGHFGVNHSADFGINRLIMHTCEDLDTAGKQLQEALAHIPEEMDNSYYGNRADELTAALRRAIRYADEDIVELENYARRRQQYIQLVTEFDGTLASVMQNMNAFDPKPDYEPVLETATPSFQLALIGNLISKGLIQVEPVVAAKQDTEVAMLGRFSGGRGMPVISDKDLASPIQKLTFDEALEKKLAGMSWWQKLLLTAAVNVQRKKYEKYLEENPTEGGKILELIAYEALNQSITVQYQNTFALMALEDQIKIKTELYKNGGVVNAYVEYLADRELQTRVQAYLTRKDFSYVNWKSADIDERKEILEKLVDQVSEEMGLSKKVKLKFEKKAENLNGSYLHSKRTVTINSNRLDDDNSYNLLRTVFHELRHAYQSEAVDQDNGHLVSQKTIEAFKLPYIASDNGVYEKYAGQPKEFDSRNFAGQTDTLRNVIPKYIPYQGSWPMPPNPKG
jgi:hypothetical protein